MTKRGAAEVLAFPKPRRVLRHGRMDGDRHPVDVEYRRPKRSRSLYYDLFRGSEDEEESESAGEHRRTVNELVDVFADDLTSDRETADRLPLMVGLLRRRPREAIMAGTGLLAMFTGMCLASGLILGRVVIAPDIGLGVLIMAATFFGMAVVADQKQG